MIESCKNAKKLQEKKLLRKWHMDSYTEITLIVGNEWALNIKNGKITGNTGKSEMRYCRA